MRAIGAAGQGGYIRRTGEGVTFGTAPNIKQLCDWRMAVTEDVAGVETAGFFDSLADVLQKGEIIFASVDVDATPIGRIYIVTANTGTAVTVAKLNVA